MSVRLLDITWDNRLIEWSDDRKASFTLLAAWEVHQNPHHRTLHTVFELVPDFCRSRESTVDRVIRTCDGVSDVYTFRYNAGITKGGLFEWMDVMPTVTRAVMEWLQQQDKEAACMVEDHCE